MVANSKQQSKMGGVLHAAAHVSKSSLALALRNLGSSLDASSECHLHGVMGAGQCAHKLGPHARPLPANEAIVAGGVRAEVVRQIALWRARSQDPEDAIEDTTVIHSLVARCAAYSAASA
jgi:hypothetical protein